MAIIPNVKSIEELFSGIDKSYSVPLYQRDYSWKDEQLSELWDDLELAFDQRADYFMGTLVLMHDGQSASYDIVDGQQRLTTFTILMLAARNIALSFLEDPASDLFDGIVDSESERRHADRIANLCRERIIADSYDDRPFLTLNKKDDSYYHSHIRKDDKFLQLESFLYSPSSRLLLKSQRILYAKLHETFLQENSSLVDFAQFIRFLTTKLKFISVSVDNEYDAYALFESLNSKGMDLSTVELLKNRMLASCKEDDLLRDRVYERWQDTLENISHSRFGPIDYFLYLWNGLEEKTTRNNLYKAIARKINFASVEAYSELFLEYSSFFREITSKSLRYPSTVYGDDPLLKVLAETNTLGYRLPYPLLIKIKQLGRYEELAYPVVSELLSYLFRTITICSYSVKLAEKVISSLVAALDGGDSTETIKSIIPTADSRPDNDAFEAALLLKEFDSNTAKYLLYKIHEKAYGDVFVLNHEKIHLEHVLPHSFHENWHDFDFGNASPAAVISRIGNMLILEASVNTSIKNKEFTKKVDRFKKREDEAPENEGSSVPATYAVHDAYVKEQYEWNLDLIEHRTKEISQSSILLF